MVEIGIGRAMTKGRSFKSSIIVDTPAKCIIEVGRLVMWLATILGVLVALSWVAQQTKLEGSVIILCLVAAVGLYASSAVRLERSKPHVGSE
jgi:hypothetical protein